MSNRMKMVMAVVATLALMAAVSVPLSAQSEVKEKPPMYSYVSNWGIPRAQWTDRTVGDAMRPLAGLRTMHPDSSVADALETMAREDVHQLPVVTAGRLEGVISRGDVLRVLKTRAELRA